mmetsp:Transcript_3934/g.10599  ORF Transcript_3934/g.10599 Transcript_3934/m.10599 type:complete len:493 (-) Transcript_3934:533-2011(-)
MACFSAFCNSVEKRGRMEMILPEGLYPVPRDAADQIEMLSGELMFGHNSLACASYPALLFRLTNADPEALKMALAKALKAYPILAGRMMGDSTATNLHGGKVALTSQGVPFTVIRDAAATAPDLKDEMAVLKFGDFRCPKRAVQGLDPIITVTLTMFGDATAVLAMARTHAVLDGTAAWTFIGAWARAARGEDIAPGEVDREPIRALMPSLDELQELAVEMEGKKLKASFTSTMMGYFVPTIVTAMDVMFLSGMYSLGRPRVFLSDAEVARIKDAATPPPGVKSSHTWVSTQEALSAYLLQTIARAVLKPGSKGEGMVMFWLDPRKFLGLEQDHQMGCGFNIVQVPCGNVTNRSLQEVAGTLHNFFASKVTEKDMRRQFRFFWGSCEHNMQMAAFSKLREAQSNYDVILQFNNQSKRSLPDFGAAGGQTSSVLTNAGPTIAVPAEGGMDIYLDLDMLGNSKSKADLVLTRLRGELPSAAAGGAGQVAARAGV